MKTGMRLYPIPNFSKLASELVTEKDLKELAVIATKEIRDRTQKRHVDFRGTRFKAYSKSYANRKGVSVNDVDLTGRKAGNRMLNSMKQRANKYSSYIEFGDSLKEKLAEYNMKTWEFFEFSKSDEKKVNKRYEVMLRDRIKRWEK